MPPNIAHIRRVGLSIIPTLCPGIPCGYDKLHKAIPSGDQLDIVTGYCANIYTKIVVSSLLCGKFSLNIYARSSRLTLFTTMDTKVHDGSTVSSSLGVSS